MVAVVRKKNSVQVRLDTRKKIFVRPSVHHRSLHIVASVSSTVNVRCFPTCIEIWGVFFVFCVQFFHFVSLPALSDFALLLCSTSLARDSSLAPKVGHPAFILLAPKSFRSHGSFDTFPLFFACSAALLCQPRFRRAFPSYEYSAGLDFLRFPEPQVCMLGRSRTFACLRLQS
jgi:hypothetical protein